MLNCLWWKEKCRVPTPLDTSYHLNRKYYFNSFKPLGPWEMMKTFGRISHEIT